MAQTKRKRSTKHRGNAAGMIEARGRTGRKPTSSERKTPAGGKGARPNRFDSPPTWAGAFKRALIAVLIFVAVILAVARTQAIALLAIAPFMMLLYVPLGYYTDQAMYRRRQRRKAEGKSVG